MVSNRPSQIRILICLNVCLLGSLALADDSSGTEGTPRWTANLSERWGLRPFQIDILRSWTRQQGVEFISPQRIAVYQVNELEVPADLSGRDASGGGGNFLLKVRVFDVQSGHIVKAFQMRTSAELSKLLPTHDGRSIVRTGDALYVMSPTFETLASRKLPLLRAAPQELWQVGVSPSGQQAVLVHQQIFVRDDPYLKKAGRAVAEVEVINADTLVTTKQFAIPHVLENWSASDEFLVSLDPSKPVPDSRFGLLDFAGHWTEFPVEDNCRYEMAALHARSIAAYGCGKLAVFSSGGERLFSAKVEGRKLVGSVDRNADFLAAEVDTEALKDVPEINLSVHFLKPLRINVYQITTGKQLLSVPVQGDAVYYAISPEGTLAIVEGGVLKVFQLEH